MSEWRPWMTARVVGAFVIGAATWMIDWRLWLIYFGATLFYLSHRYEP